MRVHLTSLGCRLNEAELESWARQFQLAGHTITNQTQTADLVILNSCAVTQAAVRKSRQQVRRVRAQNPDAKLVLSGCYASLQPDEAAQLMEVDLVVTNTEKDQLYQRVEKALSMPAANSHLPGKPDTEAETALFTRGRQRAFIKVQDGCRYRCTFCIVTVARGDERSRPVQAIVNDINALQQAGIHEAILTGVHLGGYGSDLGIRLDQLIRTILTDTDIPRLRLGSLEPWDLPESFFDLFSNPRFMPHLHLPLQSGSETVLRRMARRCNPKQFSRLVDQGRELVPDLNVTTDIIVGFPGETESEWQQSVEYIQQVGFGHIHIFSYSPRAGTKAAALPGQVPTEIKKARSQTLHQLTATMKQATLERYLGRKMAVLWESTEESGVISGYTPNYLRVSLDHSTPQTPGNRIQAAHLKAVQIEGDCLIGELA